MKKEVKFYRCNKCGNLVYLVQESGAPLSCCGEKMTQLIPNTQEAAVEKHIPVVEQTDNSVIATVGSVEHPMVEEHFIQWIALVGQDSIQMKYLSPGEKPSAEFYAKDLESFEVYEYCNLHGLWKMEK